MPQRYIMSHTSMRGIAALLVVFYHLQFGASFYFPWETATPFFRKGYLWVDLFFILSGFVISLSARAEERAPFDWPQKRAFWVSRFARIYPLHLFCLCALFAELIIETTLGALTHKPIVSADAWSTMNLLNFVEQLVLLNGWGLTGRIGWNIPSWSISTEMVAYLLFPLFAALVARRRTATLVAMALLAVAFYMWVGMTTGVLDIVMGIAVLRCLAGFCLGMILYFARNFFDRLPSLTLSVLQTIGLAIALSTLLLGWNDVIAIPGFFLLVATTWPDRGWLTHPLKRPFFHWLGDISYSVYLNHLWILAGWQFVIVRVAKWAGLSPTIERTIIMSGGVALILVISHVTFRYIEGPARKAIVDRYRRRTTPSPTSTLHVENSLT